LNEIEEVLRHPCPHQLYNENKQAFINMLSEFLVSNGIRTEHAEADADVMIAKTIKDPPSMTCLVLSCMTTSAAEQSPKFQIVSARLAFWACLIIPHGSNKAAGLLQSQRYICILRVLEGKESLYTRNKFVEY
jgi:hypothetical protein